MKDSTLLSLLGLVALVLSLALVSIAARQRSRRSTAELRARFGPEYDLALREFGSRPSAEAALLDRVNRVEHMTIRPLTETERDQYLAEWETIQARFIDHPRGAVTDAGEMTHSLLRARGYEGGAFDRRIADLSVHHSSLVEPYRRANAITVRAGRNEATTEELRSAMILYRDLIEELLQNAAPVARSQAA